MRYKEKDLVKARETIFRMVMKIEESPRKSELKDLQGALKVGMNVIAERLLDMREEGF